MKDNGSIAISLQEGEAPENSEIKSWSWEK